MTGLKTRQGKPISVRYATEEDYKKQGNWTVSPFRRIDSQSNPVQSEGALDWLNRMEPKRGEFKTDEAFEEALQGFKRRTQETRQNATSKDSQTE
ncbi:MAG: hypothetical protein WCR74_05855 [Betaproteobacteria bacterium]